jgi:hypothetical protein
VSGISTLPHDFQLSGLYFYGSGMRFSALYGGDRTLMGRLSPRRLGSGDRIAPRNDFVGRPLHRVDLRFMKRVPLDGQRRLDGILEWFNVFNHENFGSYNTRLGTVAFGRPQQVRGANPAAYLPQMMQLGVRLVF